LLNFQPTPTVYPLSLHDALPISQALRNIIPQIGNNLIINIKDTSVMSVIGFIEFFGAHNSIVGLNLLYFPSAVIEMVGYLTLTLDRKSTRLNSSHVSISYAVFCL